MLKKTIFMKLLRKTSYLIPLFCFTCFLACQKESSKGDNTDLFNTTDVLEIPIDENISAIGNYYSYFDDKRNVLVIPSVRNELYYFDITLMNFFSLLLHTCEVLKN